MHTFWDCKKLLVLSVGWAGALVTWPRDVSVFSISSNIMYVNLLVYSGLRSKSVVQSCVSIALCFVMRKLCFLL